MAVQLTAVRGGLPDRVHLLPTQRATFPQSHAVQECWGGAEVVAVGGWGCTPKALWNWRSKGYRRTFCINALGALCVQYRPASIADHRIHLLFRNFKNCRRGGSIKAPFAPISHLCRVCWLPVRRSGSRTEKPIGADVRSDCRSPTSLTEVEVSTRQLTVGHSLADIINPGPARPVSRLSRGQPINLSRGCYIIIDDTF